MGSVKPCYQIRLATSRRGAAAASGSAAPFRSRRSTLKRLVLIFFLLLGQLSTDEEKRKREDSLLNMDRLEALGNTLSQLTMYDVKSAYNQVRRVRALNIKRV